MSREQLEKFAHSLRHEIEREREERNFFQLERDKLRTFWEITKNQLGLLNKIIHHQHRNRHIDHTVRPPHRSFSLSLPFRIHTQTYADKYFPFRSIYVLAYRLRNVSTNCVRTAAKNAVQSTYKTHSLFPLRFEYTVRHV